MDCKRYLHLPQIKCGSCSWFFSSRYLHCIFIVCCSFFLLFSLAHQRIFIISNTHTHTCIQTLISWFYTEVFFIENIIKCFVLSLFYFHSCHLVMRFSLLFVFQHFLGFLFSDLFLIQLAEKRNIRNCCIWRLFNFKTSVDDIPTDNHNMPSVCLFDCFQCVALHLVLVPGSLYEACTIFLPLLPQRRWSSLVTRSVSTQCRLCI